MILQIPSDARQVRHHIDSQRLQRRARADAGTHENCRRVQSARAENGLAGMHGFKSRRASQHRADHATFSI